MFCQQPCSIFSYIHQNPKCSVYWLWSIFILCIQSSNRMIFFGLSCCLQHWAPSGQFALLSDFDRFFFSHGTRARTRAQTNSFHLNTQVNITKINDGENLLSLYFHFKYKWFFSLKSRIHIVNNNKCFRSWFRAFIFCVVILLLFWLNFHLIGYHTTHT